MLTGKTPGLSGTMQRMAAMNNFPSMTEEQRTELVKHCKYNILQANGILPTLEGIDPNSEVARKVRKELELQEIALAALTAKPVAYTDTEELEDLSKHTFANMFTPQEAYKADPLWMPLFTAPPAPVLKPIELPKKYVCDKNGCDDDLLPSWQVMISCDEIIAAIRAAGYEVKP